MQLSVDLHPVTGEWRIIDREGEIVCVSLRGEQYLAQFAAAPDMFEALLAAARADKALDEREGYGEWEKLDQIARELRAAALSKATGGQHV